MSIIRLSTPVGIKKQLESLGIPESASGYSNTADGIEIYFIYGRIFGCACFLCLILFHHVVKKFNV
jgi:hypothetical protein